MACIIIIIIIILYANSVPGVDFDLQESSLLAISVVSYQDTSVPSEAWVVNNLM